MKVLLFIKDSPSARETAEELREFLKAEGVEVEEFVNTRGSQKPDVSSFGLVVVVGGDGTFLAGARLASLCSIPVVGINEGRFGFLTEIEKTQAKEVLSSILRGGLKPQKRLMLSAYLLREGEEYYLGSYLNDVVVSKSTIARMLELDIRASGENLLQDKGRWHNSFFSYWFNSLRPIRRWTHLIPPFGCPPACAHMPPHPFQQTFALAPRV